MNQIEVYECKHCGRRFEARNESPPFDAFTADRVVISISVRQISGSDKPPCAECEDAGQKILEMRKEMIENTMGVILKRMKDREWRPKAIIHAAIGGKPRSAAKLLGILKEEKDDD